MNTNYFPNREFNKVPCGMVAFSICAPWKIIYANEEYFSHYSNGNNLTLNIRDEDIGVLKELEQKLSTSDRTELFYKCVNNGIECFVSMTVAKYTDDAYLGIIWDATASHKMLEEMQLEKNKFVMALCNSKNIVFEDNILKDRHILYVPRTDKNEIDTIKTKGFYSKLAQKLIHPDDREFFLNNIYNPEEKMLSARMKMPRDTEWRWYRVSRQFEHDENGRLCQIFGVISDINDEKLREQKLREQTEIDPVLKIYNRNAAVNKIDKYLKKHPQERDYALLVMDIDNFKSINDTYGHLYGDAVIEMTAGILKEIVGDNGAVGRYGGDEFFVFLHSMSDKNIEKKADEILAKIKEFHTADDKNITISIGVALGSLFEEQPVYKQLFKNADKALYKVKENGKAHWCVYTDDLADSASHAIDYEKEDEDGDNSELNSKDLMKVFLELAASAKTSEAVVYSIIKYLTDKFSFDWMQVMQVNSVDDLITIKYEWCTDLNFHNNSGRSGYYIHSDIMNFRNYFEKEPIFMVCPENTKDFSQKFQREFEKNMRHNVVYISNTTTDDNFYMFVCTRFDKENMWSMEECEELNIATKMMVMYISQPNGVSENERKLQRLVEYDRRTDLYTISQFYVQLGKLRKLANENDEEIILMHIDIGNMLDFNIKFGTAAGDEIIGDFGREMKNNFDLERCIATHIDGADIFFVAFRVQKGEHSLPKSCNERNILFCEKKNEKYPGAKLVVRTGIYVLPKNEEGGIGFDRALFAKKGIKDKNRSFCIEYDKN